MMGLVALATACSQDEKTDSESEGILQVETPAVGTRVAAFSNTWVNNDQISLSLYKEGSTTDYLTGYTNSFRFTYNNGKWTPASQWKLNSKWATVYAAYPAQTSSLANGFYIQTDGKEYLYATSRVTSMHPVAQLTFHPLMAQVNVNLRIQKDSTYREGYHYKVTEVWLQNKQGTQSVPISGYMTFPNGEMTNLTFGSHGKTSMNAVDSLNISMLAIPYTTKDVQLRFRVNGTNAYVDLPENGQWEQGKTYTYWVTLHTTLPDVTLTLDRTNVSITPRTTASTTDLVVDANMN